MTRTSNRKYRSTPPPPTCSAAKATTDHSRHGRLRPRSGRRPRRRGGRTGARHAGRAHRGYIVGASVRRARPARRPARHRTGPRRVRARHRPDGVGVVISDSGVAYGLSKRANALRVQAMAVTWGKRGARVNCISPGIVPTPLVAAYGAEVMRTHRTGPDNKQPPGI
ncbi:SDR family oxidoreductase [Streptomyces sp. NPDC058755]|uniref:SDR family oxidoreductase n=1 Tax=Streptomyces sp. NPDC058755 TaxID=3346624 RepID=UPI003695FE2D